MEPADRKRLLDAWESGIGAGAPQRARAMLRAFRAARDDELAAMTLGERDRALFEIRRQFFGDWLTARVRCPWCGEQLELTVDARDVLGQPPATRGAPVRVRTADDIVIVARPPNVADFEHASRAADARSAQMMLLERCIESARRAGDGDAVAVGELPASAIDVLGSELETVDPEAHIELDACCTACERTSRHTLDVAAFVWAEIDAEALRLLHDVHRLARGYGWCESDILALSAVRRRAYIAMLPT